MEGDKGIGRLSAQGRSTVNHNVGCILVLSYNGMNYATVLLRGQRLDGWDSGCEKHRDSRNSSITSPGGRSSM